MKKLARWSEAEKRSLLELTLKEPDLSTAITSFYLEDQEAHVYSYNAIQEWYRSEGVELLQQMMEESPEVLTKSYALIERRISTYVRLAEKMVAELDEIDVKNKNFIPLMRELRETFVKIKEELLPVQGKEGFADSFFDEVMKGLAKSEWARIGLERSGLTLKTPKN